MLRRRASSEAAPRGARSRTHKSRQSDTRMFISKREDKRLSQPPLLRPLFLVTKHFGEDEEEDQQQEGRTQARGRDTDFRQGEVSTSSASAGPSTRHRRAPSTSRSTPTTRKSTASARSTSLSRPSLPSAGRPSRATAPRSSLPTGTRSVSASAVRSPNGESSITHPPQLSRSRRTSTHSCARRNPRLPVAVPYTAQLFCPRGHAPRFSARRRAALVGCPPPAATTEDGRQRG